MVEADYKAARYPQEQEVASSVLHLSPARIDALLKVAWLQATNQPVEVAGGIACPHLIGEGGNMGDRTGLHTGSRIRLCA